MSKRLQKVTFKLRNMLVPKNIYRLSVKYTAPISSKVLSGIYQSKYKNAAGETR